MDYHTAHQIGYGLMMILIVALIFIFLRRRTDRPTQHPHREKVK